MTLPTSGRANEEGEGTGSPPPFRRFVLLRHKDENSISGTGVVCEGVQFSNGKCVLSWITAYTSVAVYEALGELVKIHGHGGYTEVVWIDDDGPCYTRLTGTTD